MASWLTLTSRHKMQTCWVWSLDTRTSKIEKSHDDPYLSLDFDLFSFFLFCSLFLLFLWLSFAVEALALATLALFNALFSGVLSWFLFFLGEEPTPPNPLTFHLNIVSTLIDSNYHSHSHCNVTPSPDDERYPVKRGEKITLQIISFWIISRWKHQSAKNCFSDACYSTLENFSHTNKQLKVIRFIIQVMQRHVLITYSWCKLQCFYSLVHPLFVHHKTINYSQFSRMFIVVATPYCSWWGPSLCNYIKKIACSFVDFS